MSSTIAQQTAARAETARTADHLDALNRMRLIAQPLEPPDPGLVIDAKLGALDDVFRRDWEEHMRPAARVFVECLDVLLVARGASVNGGSDV